MHLNRPLTDTERETRVVFSASFHVAPDVPIEITVTADDDDVVLRFACNQDGDHEAQAQVLERIGRAIYKHGEELRVVCREEAVPTLVRSTDD